MIGQKGILSCLVGARLILIVHMICCNTSADGNTKVFNNGEEWFKKLLLKLLIHF
jgi:hypothetical protein